jgi:hypothetical protein
MLVMRFEDMGVRGVAVILGNDASDLGFCR